MICLTGDLHHMSLRTGNQAHCDITELKVAKIKKRLRESHKIDLVYPDKVLDQIAERCTEVETGARNIDYILQGTLLPQISSAILEKMTEGPLPDKLNLVTDDKGEFTLNFD